MANTGTLQHRAWHMVTRQPMDWIECRQNVKVMT